MTIQEWFYGPAVLREEGPSSILGARRLLVTDVEEVVERLELAFDDVSLQTVPPEPAAYGDPNYEIDNLEAAADQDLLRFHIIARLADVPNPIVSITLGERETPSVYYDKSDVIGSAAAHNADAIDQAVGYAVSRLTTAGTPVLSLQRRARLFQVITGVGLIGLWIWCAVLLWPAVPLIAVVAVTLASALPGAGRLFERLVGKPARGNFEAHIAVSHLTREAWRERRWNLRRDWRVGGISFASGGAVTGIAWLLTFVSQR